MPARAQIRRKGRGLGLRGILVERDEELGLLEQRLAAVRAGEGSVIVIEAPAGLGKSRLLTAAGDMAREAEMQVLGAQASPTVAHALLARETMLVATVQAYGDTFLLATVVMALGVPAALLLPRKRRTSRA